jgi:hypothetical protein
MQLMRIICTTANQWSLQPFLPSVLHALGSERLPEQAPRRSDAIGYRAVQGEPWTGASVGVRAPWPGETQLSAAEVGHGLRVGVLP